MGKNKLQKFADMEAYPHVFQYPFAQLKAENGCPLKGKWREGFFKNNNPIILELGCGKGEYTIGLAKLNPGKNFIGIDIKGSRMWTGAKEAFEAKMDNVAFLRTDIELINHFFDTDEIDEIWITFPDPQMKKVRKRLTSTRFMQLYQQFTKRDALVHLKSDSQFLFSYTKLMIEQNNYKLNLISTDLHHSNCPSELKSIRTFYEQQWLDRGLEIKYIQFELENHDSFIEPKEEIEYDDYRSYNRNNLKQNTKNDN